MNTWWKLSIIAAYTLFIFGLSWHIHNKFDDSDKLKIANKQIEKTQESQNNVVKFNQELRKKNVQDACFNAKLPDDINQLLK